MKEREVGEGAGQERRGQQRSMGFLELPEI